MKYKYQQDAIFSRKIDAQKITGLSDQLNLNLSNLYLRFYNVKENKDYFYCHLAIPPFIDDEEYVRELSFSNYFQKEPESLEHNDRYYQTRYDSEEDTLVNAYEYEPDFELPDDFFETYSSPCCGKSFSDLAKNSSVAFEEKVERGQHMLILTLKISGTPYYGYTLIDRDIYKKK